MFRRAPRPIDSSALVLDGWRRTTAALDLLAQDPSNVEWWVQVAGRWAATAVMPPATIGADGRVPSGFSLRPEGFPQDAGASAMALEALTHLIDRDVEAPFLLPLRAEVHFGWRCYDAAIADWERAIPLSEPRKAKGLRRRIEAAHQARADEYVPTERDLSEWREMAVRVMQSVPRTTDLEPPRREWIGADAIDAPDRVRITASEATLSAGGLTQLGRYENLTLGENTGKRAITSLWIANGVHAVSTSVMGDIDAFDLETLMSDGRIIATSRSRGRNWFLGSPWRQIVHVDRTVPELDALAFHDARNRAAVATTPGLAAVPLTTRDDWAVLEERHRTLRAEFRLAEGITEAEARGVPFGVPELVVPMLRAAARQAMAEATSDLRVAA